MERAGLDLTMSAPMSMSPARGAGDHELAQGGLARDLLKVLGSMKRVVRDETKTKQIDTMRSRLELARHKRGVLSRAIHEVMRPDVDVGFSSVISMGSLPEPQPIPMRVTWLDRVLRFFNPFDDYDKKGVTP